MATESFVFPSGAVLAPYAVTSDDAQRRQAIQPDVSCMVEAPAGSGKTELLIQRYLALLGRVEMPESIVAITFTRKAAGEMRDRVLQALESARKGEAPTAAHERVRFDLALGALAQSDRLQWDLLAHPGRIRLQTIDSLCLSLVGRMPWLARLGAVPEIVQDARGLYAEAARRTVLAVNNESGYQEPLTAMLRHLDNDAAGMQKLLATMLATRDQWLPLAVGTGDDERPQFEMALAAAQAAGIAAIESALPVGVRNTWLSIAGFVGKTACDGWPVNDLAAWFELADVVLTKSGEWRKRGGLNVRCGFPPGSDAEKGQCAELIDVLQRSDGLLAALNAIGSLPPDRYSDAQWSGMRAFLDCLRLAVGQLRVVFRETGSVDFCEVGIAARYALGSVDAPTDLAIDVDSRLKHLLLDEFQDTSTSQFSLVKHLTEGWQHGDGRTIFLVGDPKQSIYRFRQAEVGLFLDAKARGIGELRPEFLQLTANYRSRKGIVDWVNRVFAKILPGTNRAETGEIAYTASEPTKPALDRPAALPHWFPGRNDEAEAEKVVAIVRTLRREQPQESVAILVSARTHLPEIVKALRREKLLFLAIKIDPLAERPVVRDLMSLTRAMLHRADRVSWLAILRAPWTGLTLEDLTNLVASDLRESIWERLQTMENNPRVERLRGILTEAFAERGRWPLRQWIERAWFRLGGPSCVSEDDAMRDAADFFDLLEAQQTGSDLRDFDGFVDVVKKLYARPGTSDGNPVQIMTIHGAKGLEFDNVILAGLGRCGRNDDAKLFLFQETRDADGRPQRLLAPIKETGGSDDPAYRYLRTIDRKKGDQERKRMLYVAATRARQRLFLLGHIDAEKGVPQSRTMLADLWPALTPEEQAAILETPARPERTDVAAFPRLRRMPPDWTPPELPDPVEWTSTQPPAESDTVPTFEWVGEGLRHAGTVAHVFLQRMAANAVVPDIAAIRAALAHEGVAQQDLSSLATRVRQALEAAASSPRGKWILTAHAGHRTEYAIAGVVAGNIVRGTIDRTFVDEDGTRWVIDYKMSHRQGGEIEAFLDEQQRRYRPQLERYASLLEPLGDPIKLGLYFPLLGSWREWSSEEG